jgi:alpha-methylacyl-CoA racemase
VSGPLDGLRILEFTGIGPVPFAGMMLSDLGADITKIDRMEWIDGEASIGADAVLERGRRSVAIDLKHPEGVAVVLRMVAKADALMEGFRPGVMERLGLGPEVCSAMNPRLVYSRMTGWGQEGPLAQSAGHDINYIALAGSLAHIGRAGERPTPPLNLLGDFGGGGMLLALGLVSAVLHARTSGEGQVVDTAMVDGVAALMALAWGGRSNGTFSEERGTNLVDTGTPYYDVYETADSQYIAIGAIEPKFFEELMQRVGLADTSLASQRDRSAYPVLRQRLTDLFRTKSRDEWEQLFEGSDACFAPVLRMTDAARHPHIRARKTIVEIEGRLQPAPAPRFSRTPGEIRCPRASPGEHTDELLFEWGLSTEEISSLRRAGVVGGPRSLDRND